MFCALAAGGARATPPNVLVICSDDHAAYVSGAYGNALARTPALGQLAASGTRFDRAFCNSPVCTASRQSLLTGRYPRSIGVTQLSTRLPEKQPTLAHWLSAAGYETAAIGKMHFNSDWKHGFAARIDLPDFERWRREQPPAPIDPAIAVLPVWRPFRDPARIWLNASCVPYAASQSQMAGTYLAKRAVEFLSAPRGQPFFLMLSFYEPHSPFNFPLEYAHRFSPDEFTVPPVAEADQRDVPAVFADLTDREKQGIAAAYYTSVEFMDHNVGLVLDALAARGLADDTIVIYLSDHGYLLGQHGRFEKHVSYEEAIRAPLIIRDPRRSTAGQSTGALVELVDLAPTILELCGVATPGDLDGRSLAPLLKEPNRKHRDEVYIEYAPNDEAAVRTERWKLVYRAGLRERKDGYATGNPPVRCEARLYDLENDPQELTNLAGRPEHAALQAELMNLLADHLSRTARRPVDLPSATDVSARLDALVQSDDVE